MSCLVATLRQRNGRMVLLQLSWKTKSKTKINTNQLNSTNGQFSMVISILSGLSLSTQSWMTIKYSHWSQMTEYSWLLRWDSFLKFPILETQLQLQYPELECCSSTKQILVGCLTWTVGSKDLRLRFWRCKKKMQICQNTLKSMMLLNQCSTDASNPTMNKTLISVIKIESVTLHQWSTLPQFRLSALSLMLSLFRIWQNSNKWKKTIKSKLLKHSLSLLVFGLLEDLLEVVKMIRKIWKNSVLLGKVQLKLNSLSKDFAMIISMI